MMKQGHVTHLKARGMDSIYYGINKGDNFVYHHCVQYYFIVIMVIYAQQFRKTFYKNKYKYI